MRRLKVSKTKRREGGWLRGLVMRLVPERLLPGRKRGGKKKRALRRRRRALLNWRTLRLASVGLTALVLVGGGAWLWQDGWYGRQVARGIDWAYAISADAGLRVDDLLVEGRSRTMRSAIVESLGIARGMPILAFDLAAAQTRVEALPWVRASVVERRLPDEIFVQLSEREPMALWQHEGQVYVIDETGTVIPGVDTSGHARLPLVVGPGAPAQAAALIAVLESQADLRPSVIASVWVSDRRWNIELQGGISVRLPEGDVAAAWAQLAEVERTHGLLSRDVVMVDLRLPDRLVVRTAPGAEPSGRSGESSGESGGESSGENT